MVARPSLALAWARPSLASAWVQLSLSSAWPRLSLRATELVARLGVRCCQAPLSSRAVCRSGEARNLWPLI